MKSIQHMVAQSGEVFYFKDGRLQVADNIDEYNAMIYRSEIEATTYFCYHVKKTYYRTLLVHNEDIQRHIAMETDMVKKSQLVNRYVDAMIEYNNKLMEGVK